MTAIDALKQALEQDKMFHLESVNSDIALVKYLPTNQERYVANIDELETWREEIRRWNEKFVSQEGDIEWFHANGRKMKDQ